MINRKKNGIIVCILLVITYIITIPFVNAECNTASRITLTFDSNGGSYVENMFICVQNCTNDNAISLPTPSKNGYIFRGWFLDSAFTKSINGVSTSALGAKPIYDSNGCISDYETVTLYAKWYKKPIKCYPLGTGNFKLIYNTNGGNPLDNSIVCVGCDSSAYNYLSTPIKVGYIFKGWYYDSSFKNIVEGAKTSDIKVTINYDVNGCEQSYKDTTIYAKWDKRTSTCNNNVLNEFNLNYVSDVIGNSTIKVCSNCDKSSYENILNVEKEGYKFLGWYLDEYYTTKFNSISLYDLSLKSKKINDSNGCLVGYSDISLFALYKPNQSVRIRGQVIGQDNVALKDYTVIIDDKKYITDEDGRFITSYIKDNEYEVKLSKIKVLATANIKIKENSVDNYDKNEISYEAENDIIELKVVYDESRELSILWNDKTIEDKNTENSDKIFNIIIISIGAFFALILIFGIIGNKK